MGEGIKIVRRGSGLRTKAKKSKLPVITENEVEKAVQDNLCVRRPKTSAMPRNLITVNGNTVPATQAATKAVVNAIRLSRSDPAGKGLMEKLFNVQNAGPLIVRRAIGNSASNQSIIHLNKPAKVRNYGIPVKLLIPEFGLEVETYLLPQWRLSVRSGLIAEILKNKKAYILTEKDGSTMVLTFE